MCARRRAVGRAHDDVVSHPGLERDRAPADVEGAVAPGVDEVVGPVSVGEVLPVADLPADAGGDGGGRAPAPAAVVGEGTAVGVPVDGRAGRLSEVPDADVSGVPDRRRGLRLRGDLGVAVVHVDDGADVDRRHAHPRHERARGAVVALDLVGEHARGGAAAGRRVLAAEQDVAAAGRDAGQQARVVRQRDEEGEVEVGPAHEPPGAAVDRDGLAVGEGALGEDDGGETENAEGGQHPQSPQGSAASPRVAPVRPAGISHGRPPCSHPHSVGSTQSKKRARLAGRTTPLSASGRPKAMPQGL